MRCSKKTTCRYPCPGRTLPEEFTKIISAGLEKAIAENQLPQAMASKLTTLLADNLDAAHICDKVFSILDEQLPAKVRILDRAIVYKFEQLYDLLADYLNKNRTSSIDIGNFFTTVPRGECLDLFLTLIKDYCIGEFELQRFELRISTLTDKYNQEGVINWQGVYQSDEYEELMHSFFAMIFKRIKDNAIAIPALNNRLDKKYKPKRINKLLNYMSKLWELNEKKIQHQQAS